jgi:hypothetical protein
MSKGVFLWQANPAKFVVSHSKEKENRNTQLIDDFCCDNEVQVIDLIMMSERGIIWLAV